MSENLVLFNVVAFHSCATQFTVDGSMDVLDMSLKVIARNWLITLITENNVPLTVHLVDNIVALSDISLATTTTTTVTAQSLTSNYTNYEICFFC